MFCPKCGLQNADGSKFCRGCGADLSGVMAAVDGRTSVAKPKKQKLSLAERAVALNSRGIYGLLAGVGFFAISMMIMAGGEKLWFLAPMAFSFIFVARAISRFVQAAGYRRLARQERPDELAAGREEFLQPARSFYETDDLAASPFSVTERTTNLLRRTDDDEDLID